MKEIHKEVIAICTRNRIDALQETLRSIKAQDSPIPIEVLIIDSSDPEWAAKIRGIASDHQLSISYHFFEGKASLARQRIRAIELLLDSDQDLVHFVDDDVTLLENYFTEIRATFAADSSIVGVAPLIVQNGEDRKASKWYRLFSYFFLLEHPRIGGVLSSGGENVAQNRDLEQDHEVECFGGCNCYRLDYIQHEQPDPILEGYSLDEDLDWSYRVGKIGKLVVTPRARFIHHETPVNRYDIPRLSKERLIHRYWFVEKNMSSVLRKPYFWWSVLGQLIRTFVSQNPKEKEKRKGILEAIPVIRNRNHYLLQASLP